MIISSGTRILLSSGRLIKIDDLYELRGGKRIIGFDGKKPVEIKSITRVEKRPGWKLQLQSGREVVVTAENMLKGPRSNRIATSLKDFPLFQGYQYKLVQRFRDFDFSIFDFLNENPKILVTDKKYTLQCKEFLELRESLKNSLTKVPLDILGNCTESINYYLGYIYGVCNLKDSKTSPKTEIGLCSKSKDFLTDIMHLLLRRGIQSQIKEIPFYNGIYNLYFYAQDIEQLRNTFFNNSLRSFLKIKFTRFFKTETIHKKYMKVDEYILDPIIYKVPLGHIECFEVEIDSTALTTENYLLVNY